MHHKPRTKISHAQSKIDTTIEMEGECQPIDRKAQVDGLRKIPSHHLRKAGYFSMPNKTPIVSAIAILAVSCVGGSAKVYLESGSLIHIRCQAGAYQRMGAQNEVHFAAAVRKDLGSDVEQSRSASFRVEATKAVNHGLVQALVEFHTNIFVI